MATGEGGASDTKSGRVAFDALLRGAPDCYLVLAPDFTIVAVSDAYLAATMTLRDEIVGRPLFEVFPDDPNDPEANGVSNLRASLRRVLTNRRTDVMPVQRYSIRRRSSEGGEFEERYWSPLNAPVLGEDGRVAYIIHRVEDVTDVVKLRRDKLDQERTLQEMEARSARYSQLLDSAPDAIVIVSESGRIQLVNSQTEALFGYARAELVGQPLEILIPERFRNGHLGHMSRYLADPAARPMGSRLDLYGRRKDASEMPIEVSLSPQRTGQGLTVSAAIRDVTERKRLEAAAGLMAARLESAVDSIEDAFALFDADDRLILCNSVFRRLVHETATGALIGKPYAEILDGWIGDIDFPNEAERARFREDRLTRRLHEQTSSFDVRMRDGRSLRVIDRRTAEGGIVKTIWDLTDDERRAEELREARATAEAASAAKSEFLASMSHELRTPLNAILGFAELLQLDKRTPLIPRQQERVAQILRGGEHLLRLIDEVLDLSRIEAGQMTTSLEPLRVEEILSEVLDTLTPMAQAQGIELALAPPSAALPMVRADRTRFAQILMNFGSNGIKYNRANGRVTFSVAEGSTGRLRVTVRDTGIGIPFEKQDKLFQPFQRAGQEAGPIEGTGIGLTITKRLAELMGGSVGFRSSVGEGSEFWVEMPVDAGRVPAPNASDIKAAATSALAAPGGTQRLVLYVEDNPANVSFMRDLVSTLENIDLLAVPSAELGVDMARARHPDLVIMDINLPGMSGLDALRALRAVEDTARIPVIALSAAASQRDIRQGLEAGFERYLTKPVKVAEFITILEQLLAPPS